jgi:hypothetical protein
MVARGLTATALENDIEEFDRISRAHYRRPFSELLADVDSPLGRKQFARLLGVMVKEPFAETEDRPPAKATKAVKGLKWKTDADIRKLAPGTWQFEFIRELSSEKKGRKISDEDAIEELTYFKYESSLGKAVFQAFRERICGDPKTSAVVRAAVAEAKKSGVKLIDPSTASLSVGVASVIAVAVASILPAALAAVASPVIGGVALLLMQVGVDGFCAWSKQVIEANAAPQSDDEV